MLYQNVWIFAVGDAGDQLRLTWPLRRPILKPSCILTITRLGLLVKPGTPEHGTRNTGTAKKRNTGTLKLTEMHLV